MNTSIEIFPKALVTAARTFAKRPAVVGEVLVALVSDDAGGKALSEVQRYIVAACREEMADRATARAKVAERKRRQREREQNAKGAK